MMEIEMSSTVFLAKSLKSFEDGVPLKREIIYYGQMVSETCIFEAAREIMLLEDALIEIAEMETPHANATVRRMARKALAALDKLHGPQSAKGSFK